MILQSPQIHPINPGLYTAPLLDAIRFLKQNRVEIKGKVAPKSYGNAKKPKIFLGLRRERGSA
jgi:hypothetical protein